MNTKSSSTLRFLEGHEVFTLEEYLGAVDSAVSERTRYANLQNALSRDQAYRLKRGLYASNIGLYRDRVPNVFLVAARVAPDAVLTHHTALEAHGVAHSPLRTVYFASAHKVNEFTARGYRFRRVAPPTVSEPDRMLEEFVTRLRVGEAVVPVSTNERTLVDCLRDLRLAGGLEELLRSVGGFTSMSAERVADYTRMLDSPTLVARAGWVLGMAAARWRVNNAVLEAMRAGLGRGTYRLVSGAERGPQKFVSAWRLYVPTGLPYEEWLRQ